MSPTEGLPEPGSSRNPLFSDAESEVEEDEVEDTSEQILYTASFDELAENNVKYDTIIWMSISLLLVLAWGVGIIMLLYLPFKRYVLQKDISSRKLHVTPTQIIYKVSRPSYIPFWGPVTVEKQVPLSLVIDIIIEQGCLQSVYGIHTFRIESIAVGKAAPVDELQVQGVSNPGLLRKVIITEAAKVLQEVGTGLRPPALAGEVESVVRMTSLTEGPALLLRSPSKSLKMTGSPRRTPGDRRGIVPGDLLLDKLEEVSKSVKKLEFLIEKSQACRESSS